MKSKTPLIVAIVLLVVAAFILYTKQQNPSSPQKTTAQSAHDQHSGASSQTAHRAGRRTSASSKLSQLKWNEKIDFVLADKATTPDQACRTLLGIAANSNAPINTRNDALEHALNLVDDENFNIVQHIMETGKNELPADLVQTILDDTLNRSDITQLTTALLVMKGTHTAISKEAKELIEFHLDKEIGNTPQERDAAVRAFIEEKKKEK